MNKKILFILFLFMIITIFFFLFLYPSKEKNIKSQKENHEFYNYDVVVIGGEPEGVAAAISSARNGLKTLLIDHRDSLGGLYTHGMLNYLDIPLDEDKKPTTEGIFKEWHKQVGGQVAFNIQRAKDTFHHMVEAEENIELLLETTVEKVNMKDKENVDSLILHTKENEIIVHAKRFIDATADADIAALAGADYFIGQKDINVDEVMGVTLVMHFQNVNWDKVKEVAKSERFGPSVALEKTAWGFWGIVDEYKPISDYTRMRGLNIARLGEDVYINALQIFGVDGLSDESKNKAIQTGKKETEHFLSWMRENFPGFERATIASFPNELYIRETRHIHSLYMLSLSDVWENKTHWDTIAVGGYPVDVQATKPDGIDYVLIDPLQYEIPFRSIVPKHLKNLLVASRSAGFSSLAAGSARIVPTGMSLGEAAGVASKISIDKNIDFHELSKSKESIHLLQETLTNQGSRIYGSSDNYLYKEHPNYEKFKFLYSYGLIFAGYENDLKLEETISTDEFLFILENGLQRIHDIHLEIDQTNVLNQSVITKETIQFIQHILEQELIDFEIPEFPIDENIITKEFAYSFLAEILSQNTKTQED